MTDPALFQRDQHIALAAARAIAEARSGGEVRVVSVPEAEDRTNPVVELLTTDSIGRLAIEHTRIEPFTGQISDTHQIQPYLDDLPGRLAGRLPVGSRFELNLDVGAVAGVKPTEELLESIAEWAENAAPRLIDGRPGSNGSHMATTDDPDLPVRVTLVRWPGDIRSGHETVALGWWAPADLEERRRDRLVAALRKKLPKLNATAAEREAEGVLVVESNDIQLSNVVDIHRALGEGSAAFGGPLPDWVVLWEQVDSRACVWILRAAGKWVAEPSPTALPAIPLDR